MASKADLDLAQQVESKSYATPTTITLYIFFLRLLPTFSKLLLTHKKKSDCVLVRTNDVRSNQRHEVQPDVYCRKLSLRVPVAVSMRTNQTADLWPILCGIATNPYVLSSPTPSPPTKKKKKQYQTGQSRVQNWSLNPFHPIQKFFYTRWIR